MHKQEARAGAISTESKAPNNNRNDDSDNNVSNITTNNDATTITNCTSNDTAIIGNKKTAIGKG